MKKLIALLLAIVMVTSLTACSSSDDKNDKSDIRIIDNSTSGTDEPEEEPQGDGYATSGIWTDLNYYMLALGDDQSYVVNYSSPAGSEETITEEGQYYFDGTYITFYPNDGSEPMLPTLTHDEDANSFSSGDDLIFYFYSSGEGGGESASAGYFEENGINANSELGSRIKFKKGGAYVQSDGTGYIVTPTTVQVDCLDFSDNDGDGWGHATYELKVYFKDELPSDFSSAKVSSYYELYDTYTGDVISPNVINTDSADDTWRSEYTSERPDGTYQVEVIETETTYRKTDGYRFIFDITYTVYFTVGYSGVDMIVFPAFKNRKEWDDYHDVGGTYNGKILDDPCLTVDGAKIFALF